MLGPNQQAYIRFKAEQEAQKAKPQPKEPYVYSPTPGSIYVIHCIGFPYYKIGKTALKPQARLAALQTGIPFELEIEYAVQVEDMNDVEYVVHRRHKSKRIRGEWFMLNDNDLEEIKSDIVALKLCKDSHPAWQGQEVMSVK